MQRVLIIKISSMGDLLHTLPAITDAQHALKDISFDWVSAPAFMEIPYWHTAIQQVIPCPLRTWKGRYTQAWQKGEIKNFLHALRKQHYDLIIDAQSALKSALISKIAHGKNVGLDKRSAREFGAHWFYQKAYSVDKDQHAITRLRQLFSKALHYSLPEESPPNFGIDKTRLSPINFELPKKFIMLVPNTTWPTKHWPDQHWKALIEKINRANFSVVIPWGNPIEKQRAETLQSNRENVIVLPKVSLSECAHVLTQATAAVCVDTGLGHLAAALQTPALHLYGPTQPEKIGAYGKQQQQLQSRLTCASRCKRLCYYTKNPSKEAACLAELTPETVWSALQGLMPNPNRF